MFQTSIYVGTLLATHRFSCATLWLELMPRVLAFLVIGIVLYILFSVFRLQLKKAYQKPKTRELNPEIVSFTVSGYTERELQDLIHQFLDKTDIDGAFVQSSSGTAGKSTVTMPIHVKAPFQLFIEKS